ncbi:hypothetical protein A1OE_691 [Candidatus Endolissoclinum faulkneri L2]|uniref:Uncharacterized protein n=1 Tax=Candidatus Endolissoclinum faulkneri L2 TaxID=1193729 RepID=K7YQQ6_9PROT|nr:hypothetical protein A1OE_691 [Candidatus Endolissoclinum faulkneri L2]
MAKTAKEKHLAYGLYNYYNAKLSWIDHQMLASFWREIIHTKFINQYIMFRVILQ